MHAYCEITEKEYMYCRSNLQCPLANEDDLQSKNDLKWFVLRNYFLHRKNYRRNYWKHFSCILRNQRSPKKRHRGQNLQCQLANEDDLQPKSVIQEIILRIVFYKKIDYCPSSVMKFLNSLLFNVQCTYLKINHIKLLFCFRFANMERKNF